MFISISVTVAYYFEVNLIAFTKYSYGEKRSYVAQLIKYIYIEPGSLFSKFYWYLCVSILAG